MVMQNIGTKFSSLILPSVTSPEKKAYVSIVFISHETNSIMKKELRNNNSKFHQNISLKLIFVNTFSLDGLFFFIEKVQINLLTSVVYVCKCLICRRDLKTSPFP